MKKEYQTALSKYQEKIKNDHLESNENQIAVLNYLDEVSCQLRSRSFVKKIFSQPVRGLYLWGGVGIGKTMLLDCFYDSATVTKLRLHFHSFMQKIHQELFNLQGKKDPLNVIGRKLAQQYKLICFDEFLVTNVADAMILAELLKSLFHYDVCLVTTSNTEPDHLYENGLQRPRFLPAIELIKQHALVWHLSIDQDYRKRVMKQLASYYFPLNFSSQESMEHVFSKLAEGQSLSKQPIIIHDREIAVKQRTDKLIWFDFQVICGRPRSQLDYLAISQQFSVIQISNVPKLDNVSSDLIVSFINLIDIFYDAKIRLIISAEVPINELYNANKYNIVFRRIESRLMEMQTKKYIE